MTAEEKQQALARYRVQQAEESLDEARFLFSGGKSARSVVNRAYYTMFYAVLALLVYEPYSSSKHSGVISYFNRRFIKEGLFDQDLGRWLGKAFELRQRGDYREYSEISKEQVEPLVDHAQTFLDSIRQHLEHLGRT